MLAGFAAIALQLLSCYFCWRDSSSTHPRHSRRQPKPGFGARPSLETRLLLCVAQLHTTIRLKYHKWRVEPRPGTDVFGDEPFAALFTGNEEARGHLTEVVRRYRPGTGAEKEAQD